MRRLVSAPAAMNSPQPVRVQASARGRPVVVAGERVESVREDWLHRFRWWTDDPLRRHYYEVATVTGRHVVVFRDTFTGRWFRQNA
jgi:uncharacterized membrane protein